MSGSADNRSVNVTRAAAALILPVSGIYQPMTRLYCRAILIPLSKVHCATAQRAGAKWMGWTLQLPCCHQRGVGIILGRMTGYWLGGKSDLHCHLPHVTSTSLLLFFIHRPWSFLPNYEIIDGLLSTCPESRDAFIKRSLTLGPLSHSRIQMLEDESDANEPWANAFYSGESRLSVLTWSICLAVSAMDSLQRSKHKCAICGRVII